MPELRLVSDYPPRGDQPRAIAQLVEGVARGARFQTLMGVTGSGTTFTMANVVARSQRPTLVIAPNKTLTAQLYGEFRELFPSNAVEYFVSYYDYYQPEAYLPATDTYVEKETLVNEQIERLRHAATRALRTRRDVIVVASVSCIFGLGPAPSYLRMAVTVRPGQALDRDDFLDLLVAAHYRRAEVGLERGTFRARGDVVEGVRGGPRGPRRVPRPPRGAGGRGRPAARRGDGGDRGGGDLPCQPLYDRGPAACLGDRGDPGGAASPSRGAARSGEGARGPAPRRSNRA